MIRNADMTNALGSEGSLVCVVEGMPLQANNNHAAGSRLLSLQPADLASLNQQIPIAYSRSIGCGSV